MQKQHADTVVKIRGMLINLVLGTDMKKHFDIMSRYQVWVSVT